MSSSNLNGNRLALMPVNAAPDKPDALAMLAAAAIGGALIGLAGKTGRGKSFTRLVGVALIGVAVRPVVVATIKRAGARRRNIAFNTSIEIARPVTDVFAFFKDFENFPRVIGSVRSVVDFQDGRSHWEVYTPSGAVLAWDAVVTKYVPNSVIAWESVVRSQVESAGIVRFTVMSPTRTRIELQVTHHPLNTTLKDAIRTLLATDPRKAVNLHLDHIRFYLESLPLKLPETTTVAEVP